MRLRSLAATIAVFLFPALAGALMPPPWVADMPIPVNEEVYLVVKGTYPTRERAEEVARFIEQLMGTTPPDRVDETIKYQGLGGDPYVVGMLFDSRERAQWWIDFSYRNRTVPKGDIKRVVVVGPSALPYMPDAVRNGKKRLWSGDEVIARVQNLPDIFQLSGRKKLIYKITDYPRNGDLRYEVEILEARENGVDPVMVDFIMVSALNGDITERLSSNLGKDILKEHW